MIGLMTMAELAEYLNVRHRTLYRFVRDGEIPGFKIGGAWRFDRADIDHWIERQKVHGPELVAGHKEVRRT